MLYLRNASMVDGMRPETEREEMDSNLTKLCAAFAAGLRYEDIPSSAVERIKKDLMDWAGCAARGGAEPAARPIRRITEMIGGPADASVAGGSRTDVRSAAFMNGYFSHIMEMDDVDRTSISHPASCVFPAVMALAEKLGDRTGRDILTACVAGFEVMLRIGAAMTPAHYKVFHTTATTGVFGAAAAAGRLLGLTEQQMLWAIGNAGTLSSGLWQFNPDGAMSKFIHTGNAAANGVFVALMAREGFTGASHILEGEQGFFRGYARQEIDPAIFADFGTKWRTDGVSFKPYPCCRHTHSAIDAALEMHDKLAGERPARLVLHTYSTALSIAGKRLPVKERDAKFSITYCVASVLVTGRIGQKNFEEPALSDPETRRLEAMIEVIDDPAVNACMPRNWPCRLEAVTESGKELWAQVMSPTGDPENDVSWEGLEAKFRMLVDGVLPAERQDEIAALARRLDAASPAEAVRLVAALA